VFRWRDLQPCALHTPQPRTSARMGVSVAVGREPTTAPPVRAVAPRRPAGSAAWERTRRPRWRSAAAASPCSRRSQAAVSGRQNRRFGASARLASGTPVELSGALLLVQSDTVGRRLCGTPSAQSLRKLRARRCALIHSHSYPKRAVDLARRACWRTAGDGELDQDTLRPTPILYLAGETRTDARQEAGPDAKDQVRSAARR
jgi:hypothetical protein